jgi:hypothetical protein
MLRKRIGAGQANTCDDVLAPQSLFLECSHNAAVMQDLIEDAARINTLEKVAANSKHENLPENRHERNVVCISQRKLRTAWTRYL